ncbi:MAG: type VI secretion system TssO [Bacteroidales bacterium]|nr:type VI secretion system TssO [Bacteroidales bacterium]
MKALNKKERNSAILRFSLWLLICVIIICVPIIISGFVSAEQKNVEAGESENLIEDAIFEQEYIAVQIQEIMNLMESKESEELDAETFNAELVNILSDIQEKNAENLSWRGDMYRNIAAISEYLISASKIVSSSGDTKDKHLSDLNRIIIEFESCGEDIADLNDERKKKDIYKGLDEVDEQFQKAIKMLYNYKSGIK